MRGIALEQTAAREAAQQTADFYERGHLLRSGSEVKYALVENNPCRGKTARLC